MKQKVSTKAKIIMGVALVLAVVVTVTAAVGLSTGKNLIQTVLGPFRSVGSTLVRSVERFYNYRFRYESLQAENEELRRQVSRMEKDIRSADSLQRENERLRSLLELKDEFEDYDLATAYVVAWDSSNWDSSFTVGKGTNSGFRKGMVVVTENKEVIGLITDVGENWARVTTILDSSSEISATVASTGYSGSVQGSYATGLEGRMRMNYLPTDSVLRNNDQVVTTGSTFYPRGLILGYITDADFDETGVAKYAILRPAADFDDLEQVFIITNYVNQ